MIAALVPEPPRVLDRRDSLEGHWCVTRRAMACDFSVYLPPTLREPLAVGEAALAEIDEMEDLLTVYGATSMMSFVNENAADRPVRTDGRLFSLLQRSAELTHRTDGAFDVTAGALIKAWGFFKGPRRLPSDDEIRAALATTGMQHVELAAAGQTVRYRVHGLEINLGSIGKGYAIDRAIRLLKEERGIAAALMTGGRSSVYGLGSPSGDGRGWLVGIEDPFAPERRIATVRLRNRALGTSGTANQYFEAGGRRYGHVLDPRTGRPADNDLASASVLAADAATADALATALFVMGLDKAADFCHNHPDIAALLVVKEGRSGNNQPRVVTFNLPPDDVNLGPGDDAPVV